MYVKYAGMLRCRVNFFCCGLHRIQSRSLSTNVCLERLDSRSLLEVKGKDAAPFLQGLITNDMNHFEHGSSSIYAMFLNTSGRILYDSIIYKNRWKQDDEQNFLVECDSQLVEQLKKHLNLFRVRKKVEISKADVSVWVTFGQNDQDHALFASLKPKDNMLVFKDTRVQDLGCRILTASNQSIEAVKEVFPDGTKFTNALPYIQHRYTLGVGEGVQNYPQGKCFPLEGNCDYMHGVSFHKGCYIGQELTARTHHTGIVRKRLMPLFFNKPVEKNELPEDVEIKTSDGHSVGKLRGVDKTVGLGLLRIEKALASSQSLVIADKYNCSTNRPLWWPKELQKKL